MITNTDILFDVIRDGMRHIFDFMRNTVVFQPTLFFADFPLTIFDILLGFSVSGAFLYIFGFLDDYDDIDLGE